MGKSCHMRKKMVVSKASHSPFQQKVSFCKKKNKRRKGRKMDQNVEKQSFVTCFEHV